MIRKISRVSQFKRDFKKASKSGKDLNKLYKVIEMLVNGISLPAKYKDHKLSGNYSHYRECHIEPDWLLIYKLASKELNLFRLDSVVTR